MAITPRDYAKSGLTIREAMLDLARLFPNKGERPEHITWDGHRVKTSDEFRVSPRGIVRGQFLSSKDTVEQGFDIQVDDGWVELADGQHISHLRTWKDDNFEDSIQYPYSSPQRLLRIWNVYKMRYANGHVVEEKWTENAGFWVDCVSDCERIYHCSHGIANPPDFESLVFRIRVQPA